MCSILRDLLIKLSYNKAINLNVIEIVNNYSVLHFDEFPFLYIGTNKFGDIIIGSHLDEDDENKSIYSLHTILEDKELETFLQGSVSYLDILKNSNSINLIVKDFNFIIKKAYEIKFNSIPSDYLPQEDSFCPISDLEMKSIFSKILSENAVLDSCKFISIGSYVTQFDLAARYPYVRISDLTDESIESQNNYFSLLENIKKIK